MIELYPDIRLIHLGAALASGGLFLLRGILIFTGQRRLAMATPVRYLSYSIDTILLTAALMLITIINQYPFVHGWLTVKVVLLAVYIALGLIAFRGNRRHALRIACWFAALGVYTFIYSVARTHHPAGLLLYLAG